MPTLDRDGDVFLLRLDDGENRFNPTWMSAVTALLDEVEQAEGPRALVTTGTGKHWSGGLDLDWLGAHADQWDAFVRQAHELLARFLVSPVPSVAALNGHTFAAGAMLAAAHDSRVMRADRGFWCLPEVDIAIPFTPGMAALLQARLSHVTAHEAMTTGRRYGAPDALAAGIVDAVADESGVLPAALERARPLAAKAGDTLGAIKAQMYAGPLAALRA